MIGVLSFTGYGVYVSMARCAVGRRRHGYVTEPLARSVPAMTVTEAAFVCCCG